MSVYHNTDPPMTAPTEDVVQRDTEARLDVIQNILDQFYTGAASWREAAACIRAIAERLPYWEGR